MSDTKNTPAFPVAITNGGAQPAPGLYGSEDLPPNSTVTYGGMSLRDYFAAKAMQAYLTQSGVATPTQVAQVAYALAEAMVQVRGAN